MSDSLATPWTVAYQALCTLDSPGENSGVGCHFLLHIQQLNKYKSYTLGELFPFRVSFFSSWDVLLIYRSLGF